MSFELRVNEPLSKGVRRVARKQLKTAISHLTRARAESFDVRVHEVRKCFKRLRAILRLAPFSIKDSRNHCENDAFRDAARPLSEVRDSKVLLEALEKLKSLANGEISEETFAAIRKRLAEHRRRVCALALKEGRALTATALIIKKALDRADDWSDLPNPKRRIAKGVKAVYRRCRKAFGEARVDASDERLHEWRKQAKYLRYQLEMLTPVRPDLLKDLALAAERLGELLGDDHDLAMLSNTLAKVRKALDESEQLTSVTALIGRRRSELQREAFTEGEQLLQEKPGPFGRRLKAYLKNRRQESTSRETIKSD